MSTSKSEERLKAILERTKYTYELTAGQRKYGPPPPNWTGPQPGAGCEIYCGKIPRDVFEDELIPLLEKCGTIWDLRLMMDPLTSQSRGFCFVTFTDKFGATEAVKQLDGHAIKGNKRLKVNVSIPNCRIFVGNIPKSRNKDEIFREFSGITEGLMDVIVYSVPDDPKKKNRGFAFLDYDCHKSASSAKKRLTGPRVKVFNCDIIVDWADPLAEPDEETMLKVKVLYVRNLKQDVTEEQLRETFEPYGELEKVKKVKDYGFIHFCNREHAVKALEELNGYVINDSELLISLAKPPIDAKTKEKRKLQHMMLFGARPDAFGSGSRRVLSGGPRGRMSRPPMAPHAAYRAAAAAAAYDAEYYGYDPYAGAGYDAQGEDYDYYTGYEDYAGYEDYTGYEEDYTGYEDYDLYQSAAYTVPSLVRARARPPGLSGLTARAGRGLRSTRGGLGLTRGGGLMSSLSGRSRVLGAASAGSRRPFGRGQERMAAGRAMAARGMKRKAATDFGQSETKKALTEDEWGAQPIAQQPLSQLASYGDSEWYQDSYSTLGGQEWS